MSDNLLPCPFCGGEAFLEEGDECAIIRCENVKMHFMFYDGDNNASDEVTQQWNRRAPPK